MRYQLRRDPATIYVPFFLAAGNGIIVIFTLVMVGFSIWLILLGFVVTLLIYLSWEVSFRMGSYLILHESHLDVRQLGWRQKAIPHRIRMPYSDILRLRVINDRELEVVYARRRRLTGDPARDMEALVLQPLTPHAVAIDLQARVERALATSPS